MQKQPFTGKQTASFLILSTPRAAASLQTGGHKISNIISNINAPLRQNQKQQLRVNTGEDFCSPSAIYQLKTACGKTPTRAAASF
jgi:hypothetical protein